MMAIRLPGWLQRHEPAQLMATLRRRRRIVVAVMRIESALWARISAQAYNDSRDYDRLRIAKAGFAQ
jgi:hypothetical protein